MDDATKLLAAAAAPSPLDYALLRSEGLQHLRRLGGRLWTDHNAHDPGITILEQLCYVLTDLSYRTHYELPDLLTSEGEDPYASLYSPARILPTSPVTIADLRKVVIDVPGVNNAWIELVDEPSATFDEFRKEVSALPVDGRAAPAPSPNVSEIRIKGLYRVWIHISGSRSGEAIRREATQRLHRCRGLSHDFDAITVLAPQLVPLSATLEIEATEDPAALLATVYQRIAAYMAPAMPFHTLGEMLQRGQRLDELFEGPLLNQGFIDSQELASIERRTSLRVSDLIDTIMSVPGVAAVKSLHFLAVAPDGSLKPTRDWLFSIGSDRIPQFDLPSSDIRLERRGLRVDLGVRDAARDLFRARVSDDVSRLQAAGSPDDLRRQRGRDRKVAQYYSVQQHFPSAYGIGPAGLSQAATAERRAQAKQLKAYLMFYDQLLANHFAQLANVGRLFSFGDETSDSYFSQPVMDDGTLGLDALRVSAPAEHAAVLRRITEDPSGTSADLDRKPTARRRNRFLEHLLARFGEQFRDYALSQAGADTRNGITPDEQLAHDRRAFLRDYPRIGRDRGTGFNYLEPPSDANISGLELRLRRKLGISDPVERFYLVEHVLLRPIAGDVNQHAPLFGAAQVGDPYSLQITLVFPQEAPRYTNPDFRQLVEQMVLEETPAHLTAHILWMNNDDMRAFESAYVAWLQQWRDHRLTDFGI